MATVLETTTVPGVQTLYRLTLGLAAVSATFCIIFLAVLAVNYHGYRGSVWPSTLQSESGNIPLTDPSYRLPATDSFNRLPTDYQSFLVLRQALSQNRQDDNLRDQIRQLDHDLRMNYFKRRDIATRTTYLLLVSSVLFFVSVRTISVLRRQIPDPRDTALRRDEAYNSWRFVLVFSWMMLFVGLYAGLQLAPAPDIERIFVEKLVSESESNGNRVSSAVPITEHSAIGASDIAPIAVPTLTEEQLVQHWVSFRNFDGNGVGFSDNPPIHWDANTGQNIIWQTEVPMTGNSSPVIWEDKLFLTGADENTQQVFCFNIDDGTLLWTADVTRPEAGIPDSIDDDTGYASPTPAVDGQRVYAMFANGELVAVDFTGNLVWRKSFGLPNNSYGFSSSPALYFDRLIVQFDNSDGSDGTSRIVALNLSDGGIIWETPRELPNSWASPTVKKIGDTYQIITCANPYVIAYNPDDGSEIWRVRCLSGDVGPSAVALGNVVLISNEAPRTTAIDATGTGNITDTNILWVGSNAPPDASSPLITETYAMTLSSGGFLTGYDPTVIGTRNRAQYWELEVGDMSSFYSSPLRVGTIIYAFDKSRTNPRTFVLDLSQIAVGEGGMLTDESAAAMIIAVNPMPEPVVTSPAVLNDRLYIRSTNILFCIGER